MCVPWLTINIKYTQSYLLRLGWLLKERKITYSSMLSQKLSKPMLVWLWNMLKAKLFDLNSIKKCFRWRRHGLVAKFSDLKYPKAWEILATKELGGKLVSDLEWKTPEGIVMKPLYTSEDLPHTNAVEAPGIFPFKRGPYATMFTSKPYELAF